MKNILVTGAAGFIGSCVANDLISQGFKIYTIDNLSTGFRENLHSDINFINGNVQDYNTILNFSKIKFYSIIHIAGQSSGEISFDDPEYDLQTNTQSTINLLRFAKNNGCKKFIYASTMSVYGEQPDMPISENNNTEPKSFYAVGKLASENYMKIYSESGISCTSLRLFNVYGPGQNMDNLRQGMISIYLSQALNTKKIIVKGDKNRFRDMVYIDDVVSAFKMCLKIESESYKFYNVCSGKRSTVGEVIELIEKNLPFEIDITYEGSTPGDIFGIYGCSKKINKEVSWFSKISLENGLKRMIDSYTKKIA